MKHLIICREYPPAPSGGIGVYAAHMSRALAERGDTVHVIGQLWEQSTASVEQQCGGRLIIHRVAYEDGASLLPWWPHPALDRNTGRDLFTSEYPPLCFSWEASRLAERLVEEEGIDLIEAQEYEAPLYCFQLRRALGLGPRRRPPCVVHLHSPTEFIARHNGWELCRSAIMTAKRLEDYSIAAADALLCPSAYLARQAESHYGLGAGAVEVIPYPIGDVQFLYRPENVWERGTICFVGRLEPRKGVFEWIDAAVSVARDNPNARFAFVGGDTIDRGASVRAALESRIPAALKRRFRFHGQHPRSSLSRFLVAARLAVVPSRWENFPFSCMEAMASGIPVIAARAGGMAEMVEDGQTGWLADTATAGDLANSLRQALATPATTLAEMGRLAAARIRDFCGNESIADARRGFHCRLVQRGVERSLQLPGHLRVDSSPRDDQPRRRIATAHTGAEIAVVVTCSSSVASLDACLECVAEQSRKPNRVVVVNHSENADDEAIAFRFRYPAAQLSREPDAGFAAATNAGINVILDSGCRPLGIAILSANDRIKPSYIAECATILETCPEVGFISCWYAPVLNNKGICARPCPGFPYQWSSNDAVSCSVVRTEALEEAGCYSTTIKPGYEQWELCNAVLARGWVAVTVPDVLAHSADFNAGKLKFNGSDESVHSALSARILELSGHDLYGQSAPLIARGATRPPADIPVWNERWVLARIMMRYPHSTARLLYARLKNKVLRHAGDWFGAPAHKAS